MGRLPKLRASYDADALFLYRLAAAIEMDFLRPKRWREEQSVAIKALARTLQEAPPKRKPEDDDNE